jgi:hypothetical protein
MAGPDILGERQSGQDVRTQNGTISLSRSLAAATEKPAFTFFFFFFLDCVNLMSIFFVWFVTVVMACGAVANIVKSSLGPVGLDKVLKLFLWLQCWLFLIGYALLC